MPLVHIELGLRRESHRQPAQVGDGGGQQALVERLDLQPRARTLRTSDALIPR